MYGVPLTELRSRIAYLRNLGRDVTDTVANGLRLHDAAHQLGIGEDLAKAVARLVAPTAMDLPSERSPEALVDRVYLMMDQAMHAGNVQGFCSLVRLEMDRLGMIGASARAKAQAEQTDDQKFHLDREEEDDAYDPIGMGQKREIPEHLAKALEGVGPEPHRK